MRLRIDKRWAILVSLLSAASGVQAGELRLSAAEAMQLAVAADPHVVAAQSRVAAADAGVRHARAPFNPQLEVAPGVGFTNGNAVLSQQIAVGSRRSAEIRIAAAQREKAVADVDTARLDAAGEARVAYFDLVRALAEQQAAKDTLTLLGAIRDSVRRQVEIGEAPAIQVTRAEIELSRAEQELARTQGGVETAVAALNTLIGRPVSAPIVPTESISVPPESPPLSELQRMATERRPDARAVRALIVASEGGVSLARSQRSPELFAELTTDSWSLDRDPFRRDQVGVQVRLSVPLLDRGRRRADTDRARAGVREQEAELKAVVRTIELEVQQAVTDYQTSRRIALSYQSSILPQALRLLESVRAGFDVGLTSFVEVLETQRMVRQTTSEALKAQFETIRALSRLDRSVGGLVSTGPAAATPERPATR